MLSTICGRISATCLSIQVPIIDRFLLSFHIWLVFLRRLTMILFTRLLVQFELLVLRKLLCVERGLSLQLNSPDVGILVLMQLSVLLTARLSLEFAILLTRLERGAYVIRLSSSCTGVSIHPFIRIQCWLVANLCSRIRALKFMLLRLNGPRRILSRRVRTRISPWISFTSNTVFFILSSQITRVN